MEFLYVNLFYEALREGHYFCDGRKITPTLQNVYDITNRYKTLSAGTDIENINPDVEFMALYSEFLLIEDKIEGIALLNP